MIQSRLLFGYVKLEKKITRKFTSRPNCVAFCASEWAWVADASLDSLERLR